MADHDKIGDLLGWWTRGQKILLDYREGGAAYTADGLDQYRTETEALLDLDDDHRWLMRHALQFIEDMQRDAANAVRRWVGILELASRQIIGPDIKSTAGTLAGILGDLYTQMRTDSKTVQQNRVTTGAVTAHGDNVGTGTFFTYDEDPQLVDDNERINTQDLVAYCISDAITGGRTEGNELFQTASSLRGNGPRVSVAWNEAFGENRITNHSFETGTTGQLPTSWTAENGVGGTHIKKDVSVFKFDLASLHFDGDGAQAEIGVSQAETVFVGYDATHRLTPMAPYRVVVWINTTGSVAGRTITVQFEGTAYSAGASEKITITSSFPTSWTRYGFWVVAPKNIPADWALHLKVTGTLGASENVYFDGVSVAKGTAWNTIGVWVAMDYGGVGAVSSDGQRTDQYDLTLTNDYGGLIQTAVTRLTNQRKPKIDIYPDIGIALPSAASESAEYDDSKAQ